MYARAGCFIYSADNFGKYISVVSFGVNVNCSFNSLVLKRECEPCFDKNCK